jgi:hypothetical protein
MVDYQRELQMDIQVFWDFLVEVSERGNSICPRSYMAGYQREHPGNVSTTEFHLLKICSEQIRHSHVVIATQSNILKKILPFKLPHGYRHYQKHAVCLLCDLPIFLWTLVASNPWRPPHGLQLNTQDCKPSRIQGSVRLRKREGMPTSSCQSLIDDERIP